ncbi:HAD-IA family hydrolase [Aestuariicella hydrocarbonica]|uniref:HAD-IA family hydrolase n=1 Tax=Pseudomaricurvus hydrocarbonicus TaxID=1470433 RepID=A0A9E5MJK4_9GAMM|nr:HAD-IA family hydrolase [Aestuariicella hydrocarbonica]NHO65274.1 HAD-IA family hydrolase [Aestuariicella hydrocarbonica]
MFFIFDWDGTLCDSTANIVRCMHRAASTHNLPALDDAQVQNIIGLGLPEAIQALYPELEPQGVESMRAAYAEHFVSADSQPSTMFSNAELTLERLLNNGHQIAVATGKSRAGLDRVLASVGMLDVFHATRCSDETASKPHPLMLHELLAEMKVPTEEAIMIGDTEFDMEMARRADMPRIAVDYGAHHISRLKPYEPILCASDISDILALA